MIRDPVEMAKQLTTYADAITAFSFLQGIAFMYALAQNEVRSRILQVERKLFIFALTAMYVAYGALVIAAQNAEAKLSTGGATCLDKIAGDIAMCRIAIILVSLLMTLAAYLKQQRES